MGACGDDILEGNPAAATVGKIRKGCWHTKVDLPGTPDDVPQSQAHGRGAVDMEIASDQFLDSFAQIVNMITTIRSAQWKGVVRSVFRQVHWCGTYYNCVGEFMFARGSEEAVGARHVHVEHFPHGRVACADRQVDARVTFPCGFGEGRAITYVSPDKIQTGYQVSPLPEVVADYCVTEGQQVLGKVVPDLTVYACDQCSHGTE